jgi:hypothetical protein
MNAYKKAALYLHGLDRSDRRWVLGRLPERHRGKLTAMLNELRTLGIPREPTLLGGMDNSPTGAEDAGASFSGNAPSSLIATIAQASPTALGTILGEEPEAVVLAILRLYNWPWRKDLLENLLPSQSQWVTGNMQERGGRLTGKAAEAMLRILSERLASVAELERMQTAEVATKGKSLRGWPFFRRWRWRK